MIHFCADELALLLLASGYLSAALAWVRGRR
jgi:hypothetical protein